MTHVLTKGREQGQWWPLQNGIILSASIHCPTCGEKAVLTEHMIHADGKVEPSVICPNEPCSFHETVRLDGWGGT